MDSDELSALQVRFRDADMEERQAILDALVDVFRPSDYRHLSSKLFPDRFVGDPVVLLPPELADLVFAGLEPQELYRLRSVSSLWNRYLSRPAFLAAMDVAMYSGGRYVLELHGRADRSRPMTFEDKVRNRCRLLNGRARSFHLLRHPIPGRNAQLAYAHGTLVNYHGSTIYVKDLYRADGDGWRELTGDDLEAFDVVQVTADFILGTTGFGCVYCWSTTTYDRLAKFKVPELPFEVDATPDTIVLFCPNSWFLYSLPDARLSRCEVPSKTPPFATGHVEASGYIYTVRLDGTIYSYRINETRSSVTFASSRNVYAFLNPRPTNPTIPTTPDVETAADVSSASTAHETTGPDPNIVIVWNHGSLYASPTPPHRGSPTDVYALTNDTLTFSHRIQNDAIRAEELIYVTQLGCAFDLICGWDRGMPLGMYQITQSGAAWRVVSPGTIDDASDASVGDASLRLDDGEGESGREVDGGDVEMDGDGQVGNAEWAMSYADAECLWTGDSRFLVCSHIHKGFTRYWRFT